jgi:hypothetical protein
MSRPPHSPWFYLPNNIWGWKYEAPHWATFSILLFFPLKWRVGLLSAQALMPVYASILCSPVSCYFIPLQANILLRTLFSNTLSLCSFLNVRDQVSHPYKTTGRIMILHTQDSWDHISGNQNTITDRRTYPFMLIGIGFSWDVLHQKLSGLDFVNLNC